MADFDILMIGNFAKDKIIRLLSTKFYFLYLLLWLFEVNGGFIEHGGVKDSSIILTCNAKFTSELVGNLTQTQALLGRKRRN